MIGQNRSAGILRDIFNLISFFFRNNSRIRFKKFTVVFYSTSGSLINLEANIPPARDNTITPRESHSGIST